MLKSKHDCTIPENTPTQTFLELSLILTVKLHPSFQKRTLSFRDTLLPVEIETGVLARDLLLDLYQATINIKRSGRRMELTSLISNGNILQISGTNCLEQLSPRWFQIQIGLQQKRKEPLMTTINPQM